MNGIHYNKICLMLPTYKRSGSSLPVFIRSAISTVSDTGNISFAFCVNKSDMITKKFLASFNFCGIQAEVFQEDLQSPNLGKYFNILYNGTRTKSEPGTLVTMLGDDMIFETHGWDRKILDLVNHYNGVGVFWCDDGYIARDRCAVNLFVARDFVEATEHPFMCELFAAEMIDLIWTKVGKYTKTSHFLPDVRILHNHTTRYPKEEWDETFVRLNKVQDQVHQSGGKQRAKGIAKKIAEVLKSKNLTGDSVC